MRGLSAFALLGLCACQSLFGPQDPLPGRAPIGDGPDGGGEDDEEEAPEEEPADEPPAEEPEEEDPPPEDEEDDEAPAGAVSNTTIEGLHLAGYQGWFSCDGDGADIGWTHWAPGVVPDAGNVSFDAWPDLSELPETALYDTALVYADGRTAGLYSAWDAEPVALHFSWMADYGIDGAVLQRFVSELGSPPHLAFRDQVARNVIDAADGSGRVWALLYDISGSNEDDFVEVLKADWKHMVDDLGVLEGDRYLHQDGLPVVWVWGLGFTDRPGTPEQAREILDFFDGSEGDAYRAWVVGGVPGYWRTLGGDSQTDAEWAEIYLDFDALSLWTVGRYEDEDGADAWRAAVLVGDLAATRAAGVGYLTVIFPGFSWTNLHDGAWPLNQIPRQGGRFYWRQAYNALDAGAMGLYTAMFDEVDEGTAIFKVAADEDDLPTTGTFLSLTADGEALPSDWYLQVAGEVSAALHGEAALSEDLPIAPPELEDPGDEDPGEDEAAWNRTVILRGYRGILGREADDGGVETYLDYLAEGGTVEGFCEILWTSAEWASTRAGLDAGTLATDLYEGILGREPDEDGYAVTVAAIEEGRGSERAADMLESEEAVALGVE